MFDNKPNPDKERERKIVEWTKRCQESNGTMIMVPDELAQAAKVHREAHKNFIEVTQKYSRDTAFWEDINRKFWFEFQTTLDNKGRQDIYGFNIGWNADALNDDVLVVNLLPPTR